MPTFATELEVYCIEMVKPMLHWTGFRNVSQSKRPFMAPTIRIQLPQRNGMGLLTHMAKGDFDKVLDCFQQALLESMRLSMGIDRIKNDQSLQKHWKRHVCQGTVRRCNGTASAMSGHGDFPRWGSITRALPTGYFKIGHIYSAKGDHVEALKQFQTFF